MSRYNEEAMQVAKVDSAIEALPASAEKDALRAAFDILLRQLGARSEWHGVPQPRA